MQLIRDSIDLSQYMGDLEVAHEISPASSWKEEVKSYFYAPAEKPLPTLPWLKTHRDFRFRPGEVTLWPGINGHGKSQLLGNVVLSLAQQHEKCCISSLEMKPFKTMVRMVRNAYGADEPTRKYIDEFSDWTDDKIWIYEKVGNCKPEVMIAVIRYAVDKFQIKHFVIDNLMKVVSGTDNYNAQKDFVNSLCEVASETGVHIHLVLHMRKGKTEEDMPNKFDIKGAGEISDLVDNIFIVWRNKKKEENMRTGDKSMAMEPDCILNLCKQRHGETENAYGLWFDHGSMQYLEDAHAHAKQLKVEKTVYLEEVQF